jgi:hypothetical protein
MSKKQKRSNSQGARRSTQTPTTVEGAPSTAEAPVQSSVLSSYSTSARTTGATRSSGSMAMSGSRRFMPAPEFKPDYSHIKADLKRIGILAGSFLGFLIILSFFLK